MAVSGAIGTAIRLDGGAEPRLGGDPDRAPAAQRLTPVSVPNPFGGQPKRYPGRQPRRANFKRVVFGIESWVVCENLPQRVYGRRDIRDPGSGKKNGSECF
jgi:hypothetical protein